MACPDKKRRVFAPDVPSRDLRVTAEHSFFFDGQLVPIRMLVNGKTIQYDRSITTYEHYHIETVPHSIIWANDTLTETWLDTDSCFSFDPNGHYTPAAQAGDAENLSLRYLSWEEDAAYPLNVEKDFVKGHYDAILARSQPSMRAPEAAPQEGKAAQGTTPFLKTPDNEIIPSFRQRGRFLFFHIPPSVQDGLWFCTKTHSPAETIAPFIDDRRELGCLIGTMFLWQGGEGEMLAAHLEQDGLCGWFPREAGPHRWTTARAAIPLPSLPQGGAYNVPYLLVIEIQSGPLMASQPSSTEQRTRPA